MEKQELSESYEDKYEHYAHSVGTLMFHLQWCTKYRYKMFRKPENAKLLEACIRRAASRNEIKIIELNVQPEHVHAIVLLKFSFSVSKVLQILKGGSSKLFFEYKERARLRYPRGHLWSRGKFASSVGFVQLDVFKNMLDAKTNITRKTRSPKAIRPKGEPLGRGGGHIYFFGVRFENIIRIVFVK